MLLLQEKLPSSMWSYSSIFTAVFTLASAPSVYTDSVSEYDLLNSILRTSATSGKQNTASSVPPPGISSLGVTSTFTSSRTASFDAAIAAQWAANREAPLDNSSPYLVCDATPGENGYGRAVQISNVCGIASHENAPVYNAGERTCFNAQMTHDEALDCATAQASAVTVMPYAPWMKVTRGTVAGSPPLGDRQFAAVLCGSPFAEEVKLYESVAQAALEAAWAFEATCPTESFFADSYDLVPDGTSLLLRPVSEGVVPDECVLALVESLATGLAVCSILYYPKIKPFNHKARWIIQGSLGNEMLPLHEVGIKGQGQVAQISTSEVSLNSCYFYDSFRKAVPRDKTKNFDLSKRKIVQYYAKYSISDTYGYGTHYAGTLGGKVCSDCVVDDDNSKQDGIAPEAKIAVYAIFSDGYIHPDPPEEMFGTGIKAGAYIHSASWGNGLNDYQPRDISFDSFAHQNQDYLIVMAAGNHGAKEPTYEVVNKSVTNVGKNVLTVCSTNNKDYNYGQNYVSYFSGVGTSSDGRIKPDICAPGNNIQTATIAESNDSRQCSSIARSGTSMACPGVAGAALLIRQYFMEGWYPTGTKVDKDAFTPSGFLIRAVILNSGRTLLGKQNWYLDPGWKLRILDSVAYDEHQGFGLISLVDGIYLDGHSKSRVQVFDRQVLTKDDAVWEQTFHIDKCEAIHFSVTLDYFDKENNSNACKACLINHLHLTALKNGVVNYPNGRTDADDLNNPQRVRMDVTSGDTIIVRVKPDNLATNSQSFAVVVSGCLEMKQAAPPSNSPSVKSSTPPTSFSEKNYALNQPAITFQDDSGNFLLTVEYKVGLSVKSLNMSLFEVDCITPYNSNEVIMFGMKTGPISGIYSTSVLVDQQKFNGSPLVTKSTDFGYAAGYLNFCIKAEAIESNISVSYRKDKVELGYNLSINTFEVTNTVVEENAIFTSDAEVLTKYSVLACRCSPTSVCKNEDDRFVLQQKSLLHICVFTNDTAAVSISNFNMNFEQEGSIVYKVVSFGDSGPISSNGLSFIISEGSMFKVTSRLTTALFDSDTFDVRGRAYLQFNTGERNRRNINDVGAPGLRSRRKLSREAGEAPFNVKVKVESESRDATLSTGGSVNSVFAIVIGGFGALSMIFFLIKRSRK